MPGTDVDATRKVAARLRAGQVNINGAAGLTWRRSVAKTGLDGRGMGRPCDPQSLRFSAESDVGRAEAGSDLGSGSCSMFTHDPGPAASIY